MLSFKLVVRSSRFSRNYKNKMETFYYEVQNFINEKIEENISRKAGYKILDILEMGLGREKFARNRLDFVFPDDCAVAAEVGLYWYKLITAQYFDELKNLAKIFHYVIVEPKDNTQKVISDQSQISLILELNDQLYYIPKTSNGEISMVGCNEEDINNFSIEDREKIRNLVKYGKCIDELTLQFNNFQNLGK